MEPDVRAGIVYIAARLILEREAKIVYDVFKGKRYYFTGQVCPNRVHIWDYDEHCFLSGELSNGQFAVWHHRNRQFIDLKIEAERFKGYDHAGHRHFHGTVAGNEIQFCDYGTNSYFRYSLV